MRRRLSWAVAAAILLHAAAAEAQSDEVFKASQPKRHVEVIDSSSRRYNVTMGGTVDMDRALTRECGTIRVAFQPNLTLTIANTGSTPVVNPWIVIGDRGNWQTLDEMLAEALRGAETDQDKVYAIWDFVRRNRHHDDPIYHNDELHDPVRFLCVYGGGLCDDAGSNGSALYHRAGFTAGRVGRDPKVRCLHGHMMCEVCLDGDYQFMDIDEDVFYLDRENERPVSGDAVARDHDLARRELHYGPLATSWATSEAAASLFGDDDGTTRRFVTGHRMDLTLRPGERIVYRWDNCGKLATGEPGRKFRYWGNSKLIFEPLLDKDYALCCEKAEDVAVVDGAVAGRTPGAYLVYAVRSPYTICGGNVAARFRVDQPGDRVGLAMSLDGRSFKEVCSADRAGKVALQADLDELLDVHHRPPKRAYYVRVELAGTRLEALRIETDLVASPLALPRLRVGRNQVVYRDETKVRDVPHQVTVTHQWRESSAVRPLAPPSEPLYPNQGALCRDSILIFSWPAVTGAELYHLQVSRRRDMRLPYRPSFDRMHTTNRFGVPFTGIFSPGEVYYWRVRCRDRHGIWGDWGPTWSFSWEGPRVPVNLRRVINDRQITLHWERNPRGPRPVRYEVYGSDEKGFSISKEPYVVQGLGKVGGNFLGTTRATQIRVVGPEADKPNMNKTFYRVVAVDSHGTQSGCSDYVEMPHPFVCSQPAPAAVAGKPYRHQICTLTSLGDYQHRYEKPNKQFWQRELHRFELPEAPAWLKIDEASGMLSGQPGRGDVGQHEVTVRVANQSGGHATRSFLLRVE